MESVVNAIDLDVFFFYGHMLEITNILKERDNATGPLKYQKYPAIILKLDTESRYNGNYQSFEYDNVTVFIVNITNKTYRAKDRIDNNFDPILYPLYESFITELKKHKNIIVNEGNYAHTKTDRFFWGSQINDNSTENIFGDFLDAIEIKQLSLAVKKIGC